jgi:hypothetical protein
MAGALIVKRLVLLAALLSALPFAAQSANDSGFTDSLPAISRCVEAAVSGTCAV